MTACTNKYITQDRDRSILDQVQFEMFVYRFQSYYSFQIDRILSTRMFCYWALLHLTSHKHCCWYYCNTLYITVDVTVIHCTLLPMLLWYTLYIAADVTVIHCTLLLMLLWYTLYIAADVTVIHCTLLLMLLWYTVHYCRCYCDTLYITAGTVSYFNAL